ncbi:MAG: hypothetical protein A2Y60_06500 [Chloroflexi bacterium RBG_13_54_9]|nr:MAG: hypothetical protein A2Y60_06500 [Chloroflexi bacterium RBG_13_54_9]
MRLPQTESSDTKTFEELGWEITPLNIPVLMIEPPNVSLELSEAKEEKALPGEINLAPPAVVRKVDTLTHRALLEESLMKHGEIWKTLAKK